MEQNRSFSCDGNMYGSYFAASAARAVCSYFRNEDTVILCVSPDIRLNPLNSLSAAHVSSRCIRMEHNCVVAPSYGISSSS